MYRMTYSNSMGHTCGRSGRFLVVLLAALWLVSCSRPSTGNSDVEQATFAEPVSNRVQAHEAHPTQAGHARGEHIHVAQETDASLLQAVLVPSEVVVGVNRFAVGLFDADGQVVHEAEVHFHYYDLTNPDAPALESHAEATRLQTPDGLTTIFTQDREFARAGKWGVEVQARFADGSAAIKRISFEVLAESASPIPGEEAPIVETATSQDVNNDLSKLTSAQTPNPAFYQLSLAEAMNNSKPTVLLFATPAFCQTRFCGPAYEMTSEFQQRFVDQINFVHVEIYTGLPNPSVNNWEVAPAMTAFGLSTEPWLFLIDRNGVVIYRVEGLFTVEEVEPYLTTLLDS